MKCTLKSLIGIVTSIVLAMSVGYVTFGPAQKESSKRTLAVDSTVQAMHLEGTLEDKEHVKTVMDSLLQEKTILEETMRTVESLGETMPSHHIEFEGDCCPLCNGPLWSTGKHPVVRVLTSTGCQKGKTSPKYCGNKHCDVKQVYHNFYNYLNEKRELMTKWHRKPLKEFRYLYVADNTYMDLRFGLFLSWFMYT